MADFALNSGDSDDDDSDYIPEDKDINNYLPIAHSDANRNATKETPATPSTMEEKSRAENLWKKFLNNDIDAYSPERTNSETTGEASVITKNIQTFDSGTLLKKDTSRPEKSVYPLDKSPVCRKVSNINLPNSISRKRGLDSLLDRVQTKKPKLTTLQKSLMDWESFKQDEGISADLQTFNKGKKGYLERQAFLMRSDLRSFEAEKSLRLAKK